MSQSAIFQGNLIPNVLSGEESAISEGRQIDGQKRDRAGKGERSSCWFSLVCCLDVRNRGATTEDRHQKAAEQEVISALRDPGNSDCRLENPS